jgi:HSP20 family molecular chaperone IbpA
MGTDPGGRDEHQWEPVEEFRCGMFERTLPLPAGASEQDVNATYKGGTAFPGCRRAVVG